MSKKRLTIESASNPLNDSAFFKSPEPQSENRTVARKTDNPNNRTENKRGKVGRPTTEFPTQRQSYEIYDYQMKALRKLRSTMELKTGEKTSLSELVREALDALLIQKGVTIPNKRTE